MKAAIYTRISLDKTGEKEGIERQLRDCRLICRINNFEVYKEYPDNSISAFSTEARSAKERPQFDEMIKDYKEGKFDVIVAWKLDRLVRSVAALEDMLKELEGLCICTTDLGGMVDLRNSASILQVQIMASMAQFESARKSERFKDKYRDSAAQGFMRSNSKRSFGYTHRNKQIREEAKAVRAIFKAYADGAYLGWIAEALNGEDKHGYDYIPTIETVRVRDAKAKKEEQEQRKKEGKLKDGEKEIVIPNYKWTTQRLSQLMRNPKYVGWVYHAPTGVDGKHQSYSSDKWNDYIVRDDDNNPIKAKNVTPIIDELTWYKVQSRLEGNLVNWEGKRITRGYGRKNIGSGIYTCMKCGVPLKTGGRAKTKKHDYGMTYHCPSCGMSRTAKHVDKFVLYQVRKFIATDKFEEIAQMNNSDDPRIAKISDEITTLRLRIEQTNKEWLDSLIPGLLRYEKVTMLEGQIKQLEAERTALLPNTALRGIAASDDRVAAFDAITDARAIGAFIDSVFTVQVDRHAKGKRVTPQSNVDEIKVDWKAGIGERETGEIEPEIAEEEQED